MTVMLVTAPRAAETLAVFHRQRAENTAGERRVYHLAAADFCAQDAEGIKRALAADGGSVENQELAMRSRDMTRAQRIIDRHAIMRGMACRSKR